jgi:hypothetical protein
MECRLSASVRGDPAPLYELISSFEGPGLIDWPDIDPRGGIEATIGMLLRPGNNGGATTFDQARRVAVSVHERLAERIELERRSAELGRVVPLDLQAIRPIPREILIGGYNAGGKEWLLDKWGVEMPLANVDLVVRQEIVSEARGRGRPRAGSQAPRAWTQTRAEWKFDADTFPWSVFRVLLKTWPRLEFGVAFEDEFGKFEKKWSVVEVIDERNARVTQKSI